VTTNAQTPAVRPDPFAVPSGTALRFGLLVVTMSTAATTIGTFWTGWLIVGTGIRPNAIRSCLFNLLKAQQAGRPTPPAGDWMRYCGGPSPTVMLLAGLAPLVLFWAVVLVGYWFRPALRIRRRALRPFPAERRPEQAAELTRLVVRMGVPDRVTFVVDLLEPAAAGLAFGRRGDRYVMLSRGLLDLWESDRVAYRAVVSHELAHLRNRDVDIAFVTDTAWRVCLLGLVIPGIIGLPLTPILTPATSGGISVYLAGVWQLLLLGVLVPLTRNSVLRSRELHADARVALTAEGRQGLVAVLDGQRQRDTQCEPARPPRHPLLRTHPSADERLRALDEPARMFDFGPRAALALGAAGDLAYEGVTSLVNDLSGADRYGAVAFLPLAVLLGLGTAFGIWRAELAAWLTGTRWAEAGSVAKALGLGLAMGSLGSDSYGASVGSVVQIPITVLAAWFLTLIAGGYLYVRWMAGTARAWASVAVAGRRPRLVVLGTLACTVPLLSLWLSYLLQLASWSEALESSTMFGWLSPVPRYVVGAVALLVAAPPSAMIGLLVLVALMPLLGWVVTRRISARPIATDRFLLDATPTDWHPPAPEPGPAIALRTGLRIAGIAAAVLAVTHAAVAALAPGLLLWSSFLHGVGLAGLIQVVVGLVAVQRTPAAGELRPLHGILAAAGAGAILHITVFVSRHLFAAIVWGGWNLLPDAEEWSIALRTQSWGLLLATLVVLLRVALIHPAQR
jgi:Zn-dependent protease with chaperone function